MSCESDMPLYSIKKSLKIIYSDIQKTLKKKDDFLNQVIILKSPMGMRHGNCMCSVKIHTHISKFVI